MPHIIVEHSKNLKGLHYQNMFAGLHQLLSKYAAIDSCKSRVQIIDNFLVGTDPDQSGFFHINLLLMPGRSETLKNEISEKILEYVTPAVNEVVKNKNLRISLSISVNDLQCYLKKIIH